MEVYLETGQVLQGNEIYVNMKLYKDLALVGVEPWPRGVAQI